MENVVNQPNEAEQQFAIQRLYVKSASYETTNTPDVFTKDWKPQLHLDINTNSTPLKDDMFDVVLRLTVTVKNQDENAFLCEVNYAGIFLIKGLSEPQLAHTLGSFCPNILYPYAREVITDMVSRGSFPQLVLAPVNFDALYAQHQEQAQKEKA